MTDIRLNISGSYEDAGWVSSLYSVNDQKDGWLGKFGDVRADMGYLNVRKALRVIDSEKGTYFSMILPNPACTRDGFMQVSLFVPAGRRAEDVNAIYLALKEMSSLVVSDVEVIKAMFENNSDKCQDIEQKLKTKVETLKTIADYDLKGRKPFGSSKSKTVYRRYSDEKLILNYFSTPHQDVNVEYNSVYLVDNTAKPKEDAEEITTPLQKVYEIKNGADIYHIVEGNSFDVPLTSQPQMLPKTLKVTADGKSTELYKVNGDRIDVNEGKVDFTRPFRLVVLNPTNILKGESMAQPKVRVEGLKDSDIKISKSEEGFVCEFTATLKTKSATISEAYIGEYTVKIDPSIEGNKSVSTKLKYRDVEFFFLYNDKPVELNSSDTVSIDNKKIQPGDGKFVAERLDISSKHSISLNSKDYELEGSGDFQASSLKFNIKLINSSTHIYINLGTKDEPVYLCGESDSINVKDKKLNGFPIIRKNTKKGDCKIAVVQPIWKTIAIIAGVVAFLFFLSTLFLGYTTYKGQGIINENNVILEVVDSLENDTTNVIQNASENNSSEENSDSVSNK